MAEGGEVRRGGSSKKNNGDGSGLVQELHQSLHFIGVTFVVLADGRKWGLVGGVKAATVDNS